MINGATQILYDVPSMHLDAQLLVKSQLEGTTGFVMIAYEQNKKPNTSMELDLVHKGWFYDLLFFSGKNIFDSVRLNPDLRFKINLNTALHTFSEKRSVPTTSLFLFHAPGTVIQRFRSTFYYEPCLKVQIESLKVDQLNSLLTASRCKNGIVECNEFISKKPSIELIHVQSIDQLSTFQPTLRKGRLLLYDIEKNREIINERYSKSFGNTNIHTRSDSMMSNPSVPSIKSMNEVDEFTDFINKILNSPLSKDHQLQSFEKAVNPDELKSGSQSQKFLVRVDNKTKVESETPEHEDVVPLKPSDVSGNTALSKNIQEQKPVKGRRKRIKVINESKSISRETQISKVTPQIETTQQSEYIRSIERVFRSFRQIVFECFGNRCEDVIDNAEKSVRFLSPDFDSHALTTDTALVMLELMEVIIKESSFMKRMKLRQAAITLISDLYNKQYDVLEQNHAIDKIEQAYYRLKR